MATFQFSENEFVAGSMKLSFKRRTLVMFAIAYGLLVTSLLFKGKPILEAVVFPLIGVSLLVAAVYWLSTWRIRKVFREQQSLREVINVTIDDERLSYSWVRGSYILPWNQVRRWIETPDFFILFESSAFG